MSRRRPRAKGDEQSRTKRSLTDRYDAASRHALAKCDLSLAISPDQVEVLCVKGDCLRNLGRAAEAAAIYRGPLS